MKMAQSGYVKQATLKLFGEPAKVLVYLSRKFGMKNGDVLRYVFIKYCEEHNIFEEINKK